MSKSIIKKFIKSMFSITNTKDKRYKLINCLGLKIKINKNNLPGSNKQLLTEINSLKKQVKDLEMYKEEQIIRKNYARVLKKLQQECKNRKINIVFLCNSNAKFSYTSLYKEFENNTNFNTKILITTTTGHLNNQYLKATYKQELIDNYNFFKEKNFSVELAYDIEGEEYINLKAFNPDIIFYGEPWDLAKIQSIPITSRFALACFCCYGTTIHNGTYEYKMPFYRELFKYFIDNYYAQDLMIKHDVDLDSLTVFGSIKLDAYLSPINPSKTLWRSEGKKRVIYAPHHSFDKKTFLKYGTFDKNYKFFLEYARNHQDIEFILKPHPSLKKEILNRKLMNQTQMNKYFEEWEKLSNVQIYEDGDYFDMFRTSDLMITDCNSFLSEYLPTEKPVIHLISEHSVGYNEYGEQIIAGYYKSRTNEETEKLLNAILYQKHDSLLEKRKEIINTDFVWNREGTARGIVKYLEDIIYNEKGL